MILGREIKRDLKLASRQISLSVYSLAKPKQKKKSISTPPPQIFCSLQINSGLKFLEIRYFALYCNVKTTETSIEREDALISPGMGGKGFALFTVETASLSRILNPDDWTILISLAAPLDKTTNAR